MRCPRRTLSLLAATAALVSIGVALACECVVLSPRDRLEYADRAFIGEVVEATGGGDTPTHYVIHVEEVAKGSVPELLELESGLTSCQATIGRGWRGGFLIGPGSELTMCDTIAEQELRDAVASLPQPGGTGDVELLAGGAFGEARVVALDGEGRTLGYGLGQGEVTLLATCPGSARTLELVVDLEAREWRLAVREVATLGVVHEQPLPIVLGEQFATGLACTAPDGAEAVVLAMGDPGVDRLLRISPSGVEGIWQGTTAGVSFVDGSAWLAAAGSGGWVATEVDLASGTAVEHGELGGPAETLAPSPSGDRLAAVVGRSPFADAERAAELVLLPLGSHGAPRRVVVGPADVALRAAWLNDREIAVLPAVGTITRIEVRDAESLEVVRSADGWFAPFIGQGPVVHAGRVAVAGADGAVLQFDGTSVARGERLPGTFSALTALDPAVGLEPGAGAPAGGGGFYPPEPVEGAADVVVAGTVTEPVAVVSGGDVRPAPVGTTAGAGGDGSIAWWPFVLAGLVGAGVWAGIRRWGRASG